MATEILKLTTEIIVSHASLTELSTQELLEEIKEVWRPLFSGMRCNTRDHGSGKIARG